MTGAERPRLLFLLHQYDTLGGIELMTRGLARGLADRFEIRLVDRDQDQVRFRTERAILATSPAEPPAWPEQLLHGPRTTQSLARILDEFRPDVVHVQHLNNWPVSVLDQLVDSGARVVITFHDHFALTPEFTMGHLRDPARGCDPEYSVSAFGRDLSGYLRERRAMFASALARVHARVGVSPYVVRQHARVFPLDYRVIENGILPFQPLPHREGRGGLRFAYFGAVFPQKGWEQLQHAFQLAHQRHPTAELHVHGGGMVPKTAPEGVTFHGLYQPEDLPRLCAEVDVAVIPSLFAETYCLVLSEMWQARIPCAVADVGALPERVRDGKNGKTFTAGEVLSLANTLCWFIENDRWRSWKLPKPRLLPAMVDEYARLYRGLLT